MINPSDFIKLYCAIGGNTFGKDYLDECIEEAEIMCRKLYSKGYFKDEEAEHKKSVK